MRYRRAVEKIRTLAEAVEGYLDLLEATE